MSKELFAIAFGLAWVVLVGGSEFANSYGKRELRRRKPDMREVAKYFRLRSWLSLGFVLMSLVNGWWLLRLNPDAWPVWLVFGGAIAFGVYNIVSAKRLLRVPGTKSNRYSVRIFGQPAESPIGWSAQG